MKRVTGIGGIFFKAQDPEKMYEWYERHLGIKREHGAVMFHWRKPDDPAAEGMTVWSIFKQDTKYMNPGTASFMINYCVDDLGAVVDALRTEGVEVTGPDDSEYGRFAWIIDPEGNKIELWEPPKESVN